VLYTDGAKMYDGLAEQLDITHERIVLITSKNPAHVHLPAVHRVASLLKRWLAGTMHHGQSSTTSTATSTSSRSGSTVATAAAAACSFTGPSSKR
jgi:hypothetical protein